MFSHKQQALHDNNPPLTQGIGTNTNHLLTYSYCIFSMRCVKIRSNQATNPSTFTTNHCPFDEKKTGGANKQGFRSVESPGVAALFTGRPHHSRPRSRLGLAWPRQPAEQPNNIESMRGSVESKRAACTARVSPLLHFTWSRFLESRPVVRESDDDAAGEEGRVV